MWVYTPSGYKRAADAIDAQQYRDGYIAGYKDGAVPDVPYIGNSETKKFHDPTCSYLPAENDVDLPYLGYALSHGYSPCGHCHPYIPVRY